MYINIMLRVIYCFGVSALMVGIAASVPSTARPITGCGLSDALAVVPAGNVKALLGSPVDQIILLQYQDQHLSPITVQIDQRDAEGRFLTGDENVSVRTAGVLDTIVDIPFNPGLILRDVETLTTVDWRNDPALPGLTIRSPATTTGLLVDGKMSDEKKRFNTISDTRLSVHSDYGSVFLDLDIPENFAITPWLYLNDNVDVVDRPENQPGQFGNVGYRTTGWENIDTEVHHLKFTTCVTPAVTKHDP